VTLYSISSLEGWPDAWASLSDAGDLTEGPSFNSNAFGYIFTVIFVFVGALFFINLFIGAIFFEFEKEIQR
jgi:Ion transport protein